MIMQHHIHLSDTLSGTPEFAPDIKWRVRDDGWRIEPLLIETHRRTITGRLKKHRLRKSDGTIARLTNYQYILKIDDFDGLTKQERFDKILSLHGEEVYLVDALHAANDGEDHTAYVKQMYLNVVTDVQKINPIASTLYISIELQDDSL